ncbi:MAG: NADH:flavin oxidoreductase [bacterium]|nr:NADH:flavin oxidoreductase [bacterium]
MKIFEPFEINSMKLKNRIIRSATWLAGCPAGDITDELISRYVEIAKGGCSLIITGFAFVAPEGAMLPGMIAAEDDSRIESLAKLTGAVHAVEKDIKIFCQLVHTGIFRLPFVRSTYADTFAADETTDPFVEMGGSGETCPAASTEQIQEVIGKWAAAARRCKEAGFDGIELHFGHGFGPGAWISPLWNHRYDDWGGSLEKRAHYGVKVVKAVREATGDWPVIAKLNCEDGIEGGITNDDAVFFAQRLSEAGIHALTISGGSPAAGPKLGPARLAKAGKAGKNGEAYFAEATAKIRSAVGGKNEGSIPVIGVGGWRTPVMMEQHMGTTCDAFAISRPILQDSEVVNKWVENPEHLTGCVSCNKCQQKIEGMIACRKDE